MTRAQRLKRDNAVLDAWARGDLGKIIADDLQISDALVRKIVCHWRKRGDPRAAERPHGAPDKAARAQVAAMREGGMTQKQIAAARGVRAAGVSRMLKRMGAR